MSHPPLLPTGRVWPLASLSCLASILHFAPPYARPDFAVRLGGPAMLVMAPSLTSTLW